MDVTDALTLDAVRRLAATHLRRGDPIRPVDLAETAYALDPAGTPRDRLQALRDATGTTISVSALIDVLDDAGIPTDPPDPGE